jgi:hypothetical protein
MKLLISDLLYLDDKWWGGVPWKTCPICERLSKSGYWVKGVYPMEVKE